MVLIKERISLMHRWKTLTLTILECQSNACLGQIKRQASELEAAPLDLARQCPKHGRAYNSLYSIPGLERLTTIEFLVKCPEIRSLSRKNRKP